MMKCLSFIALGMTFLWSSDDFFPFNLLYLKETFVSSGDNKKQVFLVFFSPSNVLIYYVDIWRGQFYLRFFYSPQMTNIWWESEGYPTKATKRKITTVLVSVFLVSNRNTTDHFLLSVIHLPLVKHLKLKISCMFDVKVDGRRNKMVNLFQSSTPRLNKIFIGWLLWWNEIFMLKNNERMVNLFAVINTNNWPASSTIHFIKVN